MNICMKTIAAVVVILALSHVTPTVDAFLPPGSGRSGQTPFVAYNRMATNTQLMFSLAPIKNSIKKLFKRGKKTVEELDQKVTELYQEADKALDDFEDYLVEKMNRKSDEMTQEVAVEFVKVLNGDWDVAIATNKTETSKMMEGAINDASEDLAALGLANNTADTKKTLKESRLRWTTIWDSSSYPLGIENNIYVGNSKAITFYGQFQFDIAEHRAVFSLDELVVFGVKVDLESVIKKANEEEEADTEADTEADADTEESDADTDTEEADTD